MHEALETTEQALFCREAELAVLGCKILGFGSYVGFIEPDDFFEQDTRIANEILDELNLVEGDVRRDSDLMDILQVTIIERGLREQLMFPVIIPAARTLCSHNTARGYGHKLREFRIRREWQLGFEQAQSLDSPEAQREAIEALYAKRQALEIARSDWRFQPKTPLQLAVAKEEDDFLVDWLLVSGQPLVIGGPSKSHKTSIMVDLAISIAAADSFLSFWPVSNARKVLCFSGESGEATLAETIRRVCVSKGIDPADLDNLLIETEQLPDITTTTGITELTSFIKHTEAKVVVVDPVYLAMAITAENSRSVFEMGAKLRKLNEAVKSAGATLIVLHHLRKANQQNKSSPPGLEDLTGSGFAEFARQWLLVRPREEYDAELGVQKLWLNVGGSSGYGTACCLDITEGRHTDPGGRVWEVDRLSMEKVKVAKKERREAKYDDLRAERKRKLLDAFQQAGFQGDTLRAACASAGLNPTRMKAELEDFADELQSCKVFKGGKAYDGYRVQPNDCEDLDMIVFERGGA